MSHESLKKLAKDNKTIDELRNIGLMLEEAKRHQLLTECVSQALLCMKDDPTLSIEKAMSYGFNEWVK